MLWEWGYLKLGVFYLKMLEMSNELFSYIQFLKLKTFTILKRLIGYNLERLTLILNISKTDLDFIA